MKPSFSRTFVSFAALTLLFAVVGCQRQSSSQDAPQPAKTAETAKAAAPQAGLTVEPTAGEPAAREATAQNAAPEAAAEEGSCAGGEENCNGGCNQWDEAAAKVAQRKAGDEAVWHNFKVEGMTCGGCERRVIANVGAIEGVLAVEADAELGEVRVATGPDGAKLALTAADKIRSLGYRIP